MKVITGQPFVLQLSALPIAAAEMAMVWLSPGMFLMGSSPDEPNRIEEEEQQFEATISQGFWLGKYLVTQAQWQEVMGYNPSHFQQMSIDCPVENIDWHEAMEYCRKLNELFADHLPVGYRFNLPTEMQWEYACRAGTQTVYNTGDTLADLDRAAWHKDNSSGYTHPVGEKDPNTWGLYDMHGNVAEWCLDSISNYPNSPATDWIGTGDGHVRSIRPGSWGTSRDATDHRCACREAMPPHDKCPWFGFRLCLSQSYGDAYER